MEISILGCGWLGAPLAEQLAAAGHGVKGSSRSAATRARLAESGVASFDIDLRPALSGEELAAFFQTEVLIITVPPGRGRERVVDFYASAMKAVLRAARTGGVAHLLYTSSTGVYGAAVGRVTEETPPAPARDSSRAVLAAENQLRATGKATILRLAGLAGPDRQPGRWLAGKTDLSRGDAPVNLVHRDDVITAVRAVIDRRAWGKTYNVCAEYHPTRADFYPYAAKQLELEPPTFQSGGEEDKWIDGRLLRQELNLRFRFDDPHDFSY